MSTTTLLQHLWVQYTVEDVDVIVDPQTELPVAVTRREVDRSVGVQVGCEACGEPLTAGSVGTACAGDPDC